MHKIIFFSDFGKYHSFELTINIYNTNIFIDFTVISITYLIQYHRLIYIVILVKKLNIYCILLKFNGAAHLSPRYLFMITPLKIIVHPNIL